jgi:DNA-binding NarL/FixJ family response regulator
MSARRPIRVLVVDDHRMLRDALRAVFATDEGIEVAG